MKAIVFGGAGFLGSHVADALTEAGYQVTIFDREKSCFLKKGQTMVLGDILDQKKVQEAVNSSEVVYNFAGIPGIDEAIENPLESIKINILGNTIILEACRKSKCLKRFIFASSLYVYSKSGSFYRSAKQACELITENYHEVFNIPFTILRYGSLYGPRADERNAIYKFLSQAMTKGKITRHGDGEELREYIHVQDAAKGSVAALAPEFENQYVVLSGQQQLRIKDLLTMIKEMFGNKISIEYVPATENYHYEITPYAFAPKTGKRLVTSTYLDMGQGMLEYIHELHKKLKDPKTAGGLIIDEDE